MATDDAGTQGAGGLETEISIACVRPLHTSIVAVSPSLAIAAGILPRVDLGIAFAFEADHDDATGWSGALNDPIAFAKLNINDWSALRLSYAPPQNSQWSERAHQLSLTAIGTMIRGAVELDLDAQADLHWSRAARWHLVASLMLLVSVTPHARVGAELVLTEDLGAHAQRLDSMLAATWQANDSSRWSLGVGTSWSEAGPLELLTTLGYTFSRSR